METKVFYKAKNAILRKMADTGKQSCNVISTVTGKEYIVARQSNRYDGWFVYEGCDLVIGDTTLDNAVRVLLREVTYGTEGKNT